MTNRRIRVVQPTDTVKTLRGAGDEYRCLATGRETDNGYFLVAAIVPPGGGPPLHAQTREEEAFYVLEGELTFYSEEGRILARPGRYLNVPKGGQHRFRNESTATARMLVFFTPAGIEGTVRRAGGARCPGGRMSGL